MIKRKQIFNSVPEFSKKNIKFSESLLSEDIENTDVIVGTNTQVLHIASLLLITFSN